MEEQKTIDSKYIQQHLANERTFLAWTRTGITIVGLGFLAAGVVFRSTSYTNFGHTVAAVVGIGAVILGGLVVAYATSDYYTKRNAINTETFVAPKGIVLFTFLALAVIDVFLMALVIILLLF